MCVGRRRRAPGRAVLRTGRCRTWGPCPAARSPTRAPRARWRPRRRGRWLHTGHRWGRSRVRAGAEQVGRRSRRARVAPLLILLTAVGGERVVVGQPRAAVDPQPAEFLPPLVVGGAVDDERGLRPGYDNGSVVVGHDQVAG